MDGIKPIKDFFAKGTTEQDGQESSDQPNKDVSIKGHTVDETPMQEPAKSATNDEISLDWSKIKAWFSKKPKVEVKKGTYHKAHTPDHAKAPSFSFIPSEEARENLKRFAAFLMKYQVVLLLLIPILTSVYIRTLPIDLPVTEDWAASSLNQQVRSQLASQVSAQYPNLPDDRKNRLVDEQLQKFIADNQAQYDEQVGVLSTQFKAGFQTAEGVTYLPDIDPYYYVRGARSLVEDGHVGDYVKDGIPYDSHQTAPIDSPAERHFHMYFMAFIIWLVQLFASDLNLLTIVAYVPVLTATLGVIPIFFVVRRYAGNIGGCVAAMLLILNTPWLGRTTAGVADTDAYTVVFPLFVLWVFLLAFDAQSRRSQALYALLTGALLGFFSFAWSGWWYIFDFLLVALTIDIAYILISKRSELLQMPLTVLRSDEIRSAVTMIMVMVPSMMIFTTLLQWFRSISFERGLEVALSAFTAPLGIISIKEAIRSSLWPNVLTTVAELNPGDLGAVIGASGGKLMMGVALMGLTASLINLKDLKSEDWMYLIVSLVWYWAILNYATTIMPFITLLAIPLLIRVALLMKEGRIINIKYPVILSLWLIGTIYAVSKGVRFTLLVNPAFAMGFGTAMGFLYQSAEAIYQSWKMPQWIMKPLVLALVILFLLPPVISAQNIARHQVPIIDDGWWDSLKAIEQRTEPDAIITSWWDFGHWFKFVADRPTTFDGASQDRPQAHWVGRALLSDNEDEVVGILRMLDCSADMGFNTIYNETHRQSVIKRTGQAPQASGARMVYEPSDFLDTLDVVKNSILLDRDSAMQVYEDKYGSDLAKEFIELTHCAPPEAIFITSGDMVGKSGVWGHFGIWNFTRAALMDAARKGDRVGFEVIANRDGVNRSPAEMGDWFNEVRKVWDAGEANGWIAPWPSYASGPSGCKMIEQKAVCGNGVTVDLKTMNATVQTQNVLGIPRSVIYVRGEEVVENTLEPGASISVVLVPSGDSYTSILVQHPMGMSIFNRLFYMEGHGLRHFQRFEDRSGITGVRVITWKVDWDGNSLQQRPEWIARTSANETTSVPDSSEANSSLDNATEDTQNGSQSA